MMRRMRVAIVGYGTMGREVEKVLLQRGHTVSARVDPVQREAEAPALTEEIARRSDLAIDFSVPDAVIPGIRLLASLGLSAVCGTTGWYGKLEEARSIVEGSGIGFLYGSNFSVGAHMFFALVAAAADLASPSPEYDILGYEIHHKRKKDSPSGTALSLARIITARHSRKKEVVTDRLDRAVKDSELHFASVRGGEFPGVHTVLVDSLFDTIELTHSVRNRGGLALGAVRAAEWLGGKKGVFEVGDFIKDILGRKDA
jgi:4-hydroxy-tetrahydrodipicolinate reductase